ncbi:MAG: class I SAM-dependent methyltransferase [Alphaproteobacteria bacterium]|nr:class I SAM-dependent methyltransferase [Alphaproteobacteria bacterium]
MKCRHCATELENVFVDLATAPPSNAYLQQADLRASEKYYPLKVLVCDKCWLVQTEDYADASELFSEDYAYFSSFSTSWLKHSEDYVAKMVERFGLGADSMVVEVAANDGYLLQYVKGRDIPCYGVEPTASTAAAAREKGIEIVEEFFGVEQAKKLAAEGRQADLTAANNVLAHVPDINDFAGGFAALLKPNGVSTFEFPHLLNLVTHTQFDTIYHEHYSYLSLTAVSTFFEANGLSVFDVEEIPTHGGSLRVYAQRSDTKAHETSPRVGAMMAREKEEGVPTIDYYQGFQARTDKVKDDFVNFLIESKREGLKVAGYGAAAKGNTLMNYAGVHADLMPYVVDLNPNKQGKYLPGSRIPIVGEDHLKADKPDRIVILPWNLADEIVGQLDYVNAWGGRFVRAVPSLQVLGG